MHASLHRSDTKDDIVTSNPNSKTFFYLLHSKIKFGSTSVTRSQTAAAAAAPAS